MTREYITVASEPDAALAWATKNIGVQCPWGLQQVLLSNPF